MNFDQNFQLSSLHREDMLRSAEKRHLAAESQGQGQHQTKGRSALIAAVGRQMVNLGERLQELAEPDNQSDILQPEAH